MASALALVAGALLAALCRGAGAEDGSAAEKDSLRVVVRDDASASVVAGELALVRSLALELSSSDGVPAKVSPARAWRPATANVSGRTYSLVTTVRAAGGGTVVEFAAAPGPARTGSPWEEPRPVLAGLVARIAKEPFQGGSVSLDGEEHVLGEPAARPDTRAIQLSPPELPPLVLQTEVPVAVELAPQGAVLALRMRPSPFDALAPVSLAVFIGRKPYEGPPILLAEPLPRAAGRLGCLELVVRAFGSWRDPFDPAEVGLSVRAGGGRSQSEVRGYFAQDYASRPVGNEPASAAPEAGRNVIEPLGVSSFRARLAPASLGADWVVSFATPSGRAETVLRSSAFRELSMSGAGGPGGLASARTGTGPAGATLSPGLSLQEALSRLRELSAGGVRLVRVPVYEGELALLDAAAQVRLDSAWRIDRLLEEAHSRGMALVPILAKEWPEGAGAPGESALGKLLSYAASRWGELPALGGLELAEAMSAGDVAARLRLERLVASAIGGRAPARWTLSATLAGGAGHASGAGPWIVGATLDLAAAPGRADPARAAFEAAFASRAAYLVLDMAALPPGKAGAGNAELLRERHRALWAAAVGAGRPVFLGARVALDEAAALIRFAAPPDAPAAPEMPKALVIEEEDFTVLGRSGGAGAIWWMERRLAPKAGPTQGGSLAPVRGARFELAGLEPGRYLLEWWQPHEGRLLTRIELRSPEGRVTVAAPDFVLELAGRLVRLGRFGAE